MIIGSHLVLYTSNLILGVTSTPFLHSTKNPQDVLFSFLLKCYFFIVLILHIEKNTIAEAMQSNRREVASDFKSSFIFPDI